MTFWSPMRIWSLVIAAGAGIALVASAVTSLGLKGRTIDHPLFWLGVVIAAIAAIAFIGAYVRDTLLAGQVAVRRSQDEIVDRQLKILTRLTAIEETIGEYGDAREVRGQAVVAAAGGRRLGAVPD